MLQVYGRTAVNKCDAGRGRRDGAKSNSSRTRGIRGVMCRCLPGGRIVKVSLVWQWRRLDRMHLTTSTWQRHVTNHFEREPSRHRNNVRRRWCDPLVDSRALTLTQKVRLQRGCRIILKIKLRPQSGAASRWVSLSIRRDVKFVLPPVEYILFARPLSANMSMTSPINRTYKTYRNTAIRRPSHDHR